MQQIKTIMLNSSNLLYYYLSGCWWFFQFQLRTGKPQLLLLLVPITCGNHLWPYYRKNILGFGDIISVSKTSRMMIKLQFSCLFYISVVLLHRMMHCSIKTSSTSKIRGISLFSCNYRFGEYSVLNWSAAIFLQGIFLYELIMAFFLWKKKSKLLYIFGRKPGFCHLDMSHRYENIMHHNTT